MQRFTLAAAALLLLASAQAASAQRRLTGTVTEAGTGVPVVSATVTIVGSTVGTHTGDDGRFVLTIPSGPQTLRVRRIGFRVQDVAIGADQAEVTVSFVRDVLQLEAQVITGAVTSVSRANAANDVAQVTGDQLNRAPTPTLENALQAKIAGATVTTNSGAPGGGAQFRIRGASSILGNSDPLYRRRRRHREQSGHPAGHQRGAPAIRNTSESTNQDNGTNRLADLNPNDIENIEILKGASAAASTAPARRTVSCSSRRSAAPRARPSSRSRSGSAPSRSRTSSARATSRSPKPTTVGGTNGLSAAAVAANYAQCNGFCDLRGRAVRQQDLSYETSLSSRGGNPTVQYFASGLVKRDAGITPNSGYSKQSAPMNVNADLTPRSTASVNTNVIHCRAERSLATTTTRTSHPTSRSPRRRASSTSGSATGCTR